MAAGGSRVAVVAAIVGNTFVMIAKFVAFAVTGSGAMLSEGIHSVADILNQVLLLVGVVRSRREPDPKHPYGYGREEYVWALMSAVGIFFLGCGVTVYHGITGLMHPHKLVGLWWAVGVLLVSLVIEGAILMVAVREVSKQAKQKQRGFWEYLSDGADPSNVAVLMEDAAACLGILIALTGIVLVKVTGQLFWDSVCSILIGLLLGAVAVWLVRRNHTMLVGRSIPLSVQEQVREILESFDTVKEVPKVKGRVIDTNTYDIMAAVDFDGQAFLKRLRGGLGDDYEAIDSYEDFESFAEAFAEELVTAVGKEIDELERELRAKIPEAVHIDLEAH